MADENISESKPSEISIPDSSIASGLASSSQKSINEDRNNTRVIQSSDKSDS